MIGEGKRGEVQDNVCFSLESHERTLDLEAACTEVS